MNKLFSDNLPKDHDLWNVRGHGPPADGEFDKKFRWGLFNIGFDITIL